MTHKKKFIPVMLTVLCIIAVGIIVIQKQLDRSNIQNDGEVYLEFSHGVTSPDPEQGIIECDGEYVSFDYTFNNGDLPSNFGMLLFLDGMIQPYSTDENDTVQVMHIIKLQPGEEKTINICFAPITAEKSRSSLYITAVYDAENALADAEKQNGFVHHLSQSLPFWIEHSTAQSQQGLENIDFSPCGAESVDIIFSKYDKLPEYGPITLNFTLSDQEKAELHLWVYSADHSDMDYRIYFFENHRPVMLKGQMYQDIHIAAGSYADITVGFDFLLAKSFYYAIAVPLNVEDRWEAPQILKSKSIIFNEKELIGINRLYS